MSVKKIIVGGSVKGRLSKKRVPIASGDRYGKWTFVKTSVVRNGGKPVNGWKMECACGVIKHARQSNVRRSKMCVACLKKKKSDEAYSREPLYRVWQRLAAHELLANPLKSYQIFKRWMGEFRYVYTTEASGVISKKTAIRSNQKITSGVLICVNGEYDTLSGWGTRIGMTRQRASVLHKGDRFIERIKKYLGGVDAGEKTGRILSRKKPRNKK